MRRPLSITIGSSALILAIAAGVTESVLAIAHLVAGSGLSPADGIQIGVRSIVYAAGVALAVLAYQGRRFARWALLIMIGLLWLGTLLIPMAAEVVNGAGLWSAFGGDVDPIFPVVRSLHLLLVPIGLIGLFRPSASDFVAGPTRTAIPS